jgi:hypothetical protein
MRRAEQRGDNRRFAGYPKNPLSCHSREDIGSDVGGKGIVQSKRLLLSQSTQIVSPAPLQISTREQLKYKLHKFCNPENIFQ